MLNYPPANSSSSSVRKIIPYFMSAKTKTEKCFNPQLTDSLNTEGLGIVSGLS